VWWLMVTLVKRSSGSVDHPPVDARPLVGSRRGLFWVMVLVFGFLLMPVPMRVSLAGKDLPPAPPAATAPAP